MSNEDKTLTELFIGASPFFIKVAELVVAVLCLILIYVPFDNRLQTNLNHVGIIYVAYCSAIIINSVLIFSHLKGQHVPRTTLYVFAGVCGALFFVAGCVALHDWWTILHSLYFHPPKMFMDMMISSGIFAILNAVLFFAEIYLIFRYG